MSAEEKNSKIIDFLKSKYNKFSLLEYLYEIDSDNSIFPNKELGFSKDFEKYFSKTYKEIIENDSLSDKEKKLKILSFLKENYSKTIKYSRRSFPIWADCSVVYTPKPFNESGFNILSADVQNYIYNLPIKNENLKYSEVSSVEEKAPTLEIEFKKDLEGRASLLKQANIDINDPKYNSFGKHGNNGSAQSLNHIIDSIAISNYNGVLLKIFNKNKKIQKENLETAKINEEIKKENLEIEEDLKNPLSNKKIRELKPIKNFVPYCDENGLLINKPGITDTLYGFANGKLRHFEEKNIKNFQQIVDNTPFPNYNRKENDIIPVFKMSEYSKYDGTKITSKRIKKRHIKNENGSIEPILFYIDIGPDFYVIFDARALLRQLRRHKVISSKNNISIKDLFNFIKNDVIILNNKLGQKIVKIYINDNNKATKEALPLPDTREPIDSKSKFKIEDIVKKEDNGYLSIDVGVTNPIGYTIGILSCQDKGGFSKIKNSNIFKKEILSSMSSNEDKKELAKINKRLDDLNSDLEKEAFEKLSEDEKLIFKNVKDNLPRAVHERLEKDFQYKISHEDINENSKVISDHLINIGRNNEAYSDDKQKKPIYDKTFIYKYSRLIEEELGLTKEIKDKFFSEKRNLQKSSKVYKKIYITRLEKIRHKTNQIVKEARKSTGLQNIIVFAENLELVGKFGSGKGKNRKSFLDFFNNKLNGQWHMKIFSKCIRDLAQNKGLNVVLVNPKYTSQHCTECGFINADNRNGEIFKCLRCKYSDNCDSVISPNNILTVGVSGNAFKKTKKILKKLKQKNPSKPRMARAKMTIKPPEALEDSKCLN